MYRPAGSATQAQIGTSMDKITGKITEVALFAQHAAQSASAALKSVLSEWTEDYAGEAAEQTAKQVPSCSLDLRAQEHAHWEETSSGAQGGDLFRCAGLPLAAPAHHYREPVLGERVDAANGRLRRAIESARLARASGAEPTGSCCEQPAGLAGHGVADVRGAQTAEGRAASDERAAELERETKELREKLQSAREEAASLRRRSRLREREPLPHMWGDDSRCVVCLDGMRSYVVIPCGHKCLCSMCARRYQAHLAMGEARGCSFPELPRDDGSTPLKGVKGHCGAVQKGSRDRVDDVSMPASSNDTSTTGHTCPLCRQPATAVLRIWE